MREEKIEGREPATKDGSRVEGKGKTFRFREKKRDQELIRAGKEGDELSVQKGFSLAGCEREAWPSMLTGKGRVWVISFKKNHQWHPLAEENIWSNWR